MAGRSSASGAHSGRLPVVAQHFAVALDGASAAGATVELLDLRRLELPISNPEL